MKRAEKREPKSSSMGSMPGMNAYQTHPGAHPGYAAAQYAQQGTTL